jgi:DNA-binding MarR family transcriptional regulator
MKPESSEYGEFSGLIGHLIRSLSLLERDQKICCGTTMSQCYTIETLAQKGTLSMNELAQHMGVTISTMTRVVDVLVRDGVVSRGSNPKDRRQVRIGLTDKGNDLARQLEGCSDEYSKQILNQVPPEHRGGVLKSLRLIADAIDKVRCEHSKRPS